MKKCILFLSLLLATAGLHAETFYQQLCAYNPNWRSYAHRVPQAQALTFHTDAEYVQAHLGEVIRILRGNPTHHLKADQLRQRRRMITLLEGYRKRGQFPHNHHFAQRTPVFIDEHGTYCAVGYLMQQTGHDVLAKRIAGQEQFDWVRNIQDPGVVAWQPGTGLSLEELKLIQGAYDFYLPDALIVHNRFEIPQKPEVGTRYFTDKASGNPLPREVANIWLSGEGKNGVLHGKWVQNYDVNMPWIIGYYEQGKRSGKWMEYYQGTHQLCRTEVWRNDKLNGKRIRYDRNGAIIEEIIFREGVAITKTNIDLGQNLEYVRRPIDSVLVSTEIFTLGGELVAAGIERIHNPGNLKWFQNIELTALNTMAVSVQTRQGSSRSAGAGNGNMSNGNVELFESPPLVEYKKEGTWTYYRQYASGQMSQEPLQFELSRHFPNVWSSLWMYQGYFDLEKATGDLDSLCVTFEDDYLTSMVGQGTGSYVHWQVSYHQDQSPDPTTLAANPFHLSYNPFTFTPARPIRMCGELDALGRPIGEWKRYNRQQQLIKTETFTIAWRKEDDEQW